MAEPSDNPQRFRFPARLRVRRRRDFARVLKEGRRAVDPHLTLWAIPNGLNESRLGIVVSRRHGGAVQRNRFKRVVRAAFRFARHGLPAGLDLVCAPRGPGPLRLEACIQSLRRLAERLARREAPP